MCRAALASSVPVSVYGYNPQPVAPNETAQVFLSASIDDDPDGNQECTLTDENWSWSVSALKHSTNGGQSWTSIQPPYTMATFDPTNQSYTDMSVTLGSPGLWKFTVAASVSYKSSCGDGGGSGNTDVTVKVGAGPKNWNYLPKAIGEYSYEDENGNNVGGEDGRLIAPIDQTLSSPSPTPQSVEVRAGQSLDCEVEWATDTDTWTMTMQDGTTATGTEDEETKYKWTWEGGPNNAAPSSSGFEDPNSLLTTWTAPTTEGSYTLKCTIDDPHSDTGIRGGTPPRATGVTAPQTGDRNDDALVRSVQVTVLPPVKTWSASPAISGTVVTSDGVTKVAPGGGLTLQMQNAADKDSWSLGTQSGEEDDSVASYSWTGPGTFGTPNGSSTTWTAPSAAGPQTYVLTCTLDDAPAVVPANESGTRDDDPSAKTITITVPKACDITLSSSELKWNSVLMTWNACTDDDFISYQLHRSTTSASFTPDSSTRINRGGDESLRNKTSYRDTGLSPLTTYYYALVVGHGGTTTTSRKTVTTPDKPPFEVKFADDQLARSCAGGIGVDGVHDFSIVGEAKNEDGTLVTNTALEFSFEGNKGHNYGNDAQGNALPQKKAKFVVPNGNGGYDLVETMTASTDQYGKVGVHVLSSDTISGDIEIKVKWRNAQNQLKEVGNKACDFGAAQTIRRFANTTDPDEPSDTGWLFDFPQLRGAGATTPAKVYLKFMRDPDDGDVDGNWSFVNGHSLLIRVESIDVKDGGSASNSDYATIVNPSDVNSVVRVATTSGDGAAQVTVKAQLKIDEAKVVWVKSYDLSQWNE